MRSIPTILCLLLIACLFSCKDRGSAPNEQTQNHPVFWQAVTCPETNIRHFAGNNTGDIFAESPNGVLKSTDGGSTWQYCLQAHTNWSVATGLGGWVFTTDMMRVYFSPDNGLTWSASDSGLANVSLSGAIIVGANGHVFAGSLTAGVFCSTDGGTSWHSTNLADRDVRILFFDSSGYLYAGCEDRGTTIFRSSDNGATWLESSFPTGDYISSFASDGLGNLYAGGSRHLYHSASFGNQWTPIAEAPARIVAICAVPRGPIYVALAGSDVLFSNDDGQTWHSQSAGIPSTWAASLFLDTRGYLYVGTADFGIFRSIQKVR